MTGECHRTLWTRASFFPVPVEVWDLSRNAEMHLGWYGVYFGPLAHLAERLICIQEVSGSTPLWSTNFRLYSSTVRAAAF